MLKATLRGAALVGLLAWSVPAFAEVQNVRVSGDITTRAFFRSNLDLNAHDDNNDFNGDPQQAVDDIHPVHDGHDDFFMTTTGINVGADLTENVSAFVRVANERDWNSSEQSELDTAGNVHESRNRGDVEISQAYVTLKELFYSPLTVRVGTQPITWGRGFVLGSSLLQSIAGNSANPVNISNGASLVGIDRNNAISADEYTDFTAFDAIRATLDLSGLAADVPPVTLDYVYIKGDENQIGSSDDVNIQGVNLSTRFDSMNSEFESYFLHKLDRSVLLYQTLGASPAPAESDTGNINTLGFRGSVQPVEGSLLFGELAYQWGQRGVDPYGILSAGDSHQAWAADLGAEYTLSDVAMTPKFGAEWIFYSGKDLDGAIAGWDPIARSYFTSALREFQNPGFYPAAQTCNTSGSTGGAGGAFGPCTGSSTNQHQLSLYASLKPIEDLTVAPRLSWFILDVPALPTGADGNLNIKRQSYAGWEWDTQVTYDYTDDVQFGVLYGLFGPGPVYRHPNDNKSQELVTTVSVKF